MVQLGFSLYPEGHEQETLRNYIQQFPKAIFSRVFLSFLQLNPSDQALLHHYQQIIAICRKAGFEVVGDLSPQLLTGLGWKEDILGQAKAFGLTGVRLDEAYSASRIKQLLDQEREMILELNMSVDSKLATDLLALGVSPERLTACHNFYPKAYTGLSKSHFHFMNQAYRTMGLATAAFVSAASAQQGAWAYDEGLPTLEEHRQLALADQLRYLLAAGDVDTIILSNQFISKEELQIMIEVFETNKEEIELEWESDLVLTPLEEAILAYPHHYRPDISDYLIRSTMPRLVYGQKDHPVRIQEKKAKRGDILLANQNYGRYAGELSLALCDLELDERTNIIGRLSPYSIELIAFLKPNDAFRLRRKEGISEST